MPTFAQISRRRLLRGGALLISGALIPSPGRAALERAAEPANVTAWVKVDRRNDVTLIASQSEMGQGITTTLAAALADELYLQPEAIRLEFAPFDPSYRDPVYDWMFTGNSQGTSSFYDLMRRMGAAAREMLTVAAATHWHIDAGTIHLKDGRLYHPDGGQTLTFGQVAPDAARLAVPPNPILRSQAPSAGRPLRRWDIPQKVDGSAEFGIDVRLPQMLFAAVRCAPRFGAKLEHHDAAALGSKPGVAAVIELPGGLAVAAKTYWQAWRALSDADLKWSDEGSAFSSSSDLAPIYSDRLESGPFYTHRHTDASPNAGGLAASLSSTYRVQFQAHATMEPMNCTAHLSNGRCEVWAPTQGVELVQNVAAQVTGLPLDRITIHRTFLGGGFGRRLLADFIKQTLIVAIAVKRPVKLIWSREEDMSHDFYRPGVLHKISADLDAAGSPVALSHRVVSPSHMLYIFPRGMFPQLKDWTLPVAPPDKFDTMSVEGVLELPYDIARQQVELHRLDLDVPVSVWRTTGHGPNNFAVESFVDELATAAKKDPIAFRRALLRSDARARKVLNVAAEKADWAGARGASAQGVALAKAFGGYVAAVAEVSVKDTAVKVKRLTLAVDCGRLLDPGIASSNIEGGAVWGLSAMKTAITFEGGRVLQTNFNTFEPLQLRDTPRIDVHFVFNTEKPGGTGELGPVPVPAAVCNAIFAATGKRIRTLPLSASGFSFG